ncbi:4Fe-4S ferredoxin [Chromatiales bacterium (ex Bugula neritina AB1)]|nr:4Fe-4S ferredoxin [Chromatiales bacterium (ex Bugula neritina AB1)]
MTEQCKSTTPGEIRPIVDAARCEGKAECVVVCPYNVFEVVTLPAEIYRSLSLIGKLKARAHGMKTAATPRADQCLNCGLCVAACPEKAIKLQRHTTD